MGDWHHLHRATLYTDTHSACGTDQRTRITSETRQVFFSTYAPVGIGEQAVRQQLENIRDNVKIIAPEAEVMLLEVFSAG